MANILDKIKDDAREKFRKVVLPEGVEPRVIRAARGIVEDKIAEVVLLGDKSKIESLAKEHKLNLELVEVIDPATSDLLPEFSAEFYKLREKKGITEQQAEETMKEVLHFGAMMVRKGLADGSVAGSVNTTGNVLRAGIQVIGKQ